MLHLCRLYLMCLMYQMFFIKSGEVRAAQEVRSNQGW
jgi:hypothetical protein